MKVSFTALGAGQEVGRSCFILTFHVQDGKDVNIMLDAGAHLRSSEERFPDISRIPEKLHAIIITHYHLDHSGALPWLKELTSVICAEREAPQVILTAPTRLLAPLVLQEFGASDGSYLAVHIERSFMDTQVIGLHERTRLEIFGEEIFLTTFFAGHVLGGVMVLLECRGVSVLYTGDYSAVADGLMDGARVPSHLLPPHGIDLVISESTYATSIRECVIKRRTKLITAVEGCVKKNGIALVPVLSVGRAQELACLLMSSEVLKASNTTFYTTSAPSYKAFNMFPLFKSGWWAKEGVWTLPDIKLIENVNEVQKPAVVFAGPAAIESGKSLEFFTQLCGSAENLILINGYCPQGSVGNRLIMYHSKRTRKEQRVVQITPEKTAIVECALDYVAFTGHTDKAGIISVLQQLNPRNIILVHGENEKMQKLAKELGPFAIVPENFETIEFDFEEMVEVELNDACFESYLDSHQCEVSPAKLTRVLI